IVATLSHVMQHIYVGSSILLPLIISELGLNYREFGLAVAASSLLGGLSQIIFSLASRRIARHILLGMGNIMLSLGTLLTGLSRKLIDFAAARLISNIGVAPQHPMGTAIVSERFSGKALGRAIGLHYGLAYIGNIIGPALMTILSVAVGWRSTLLIFSIPAFLTGLVVIWYLGGMGVGQGRTRKDQPAVRTSLKDDLAALLRVRSIILIFVAQALLSGGLEIGVLTTYIPIFLADFLGMEVYERGIVYTIGLLGGVIGPILLGGYAGRIGYIKTAAPSILLASTLIYLLALYDVGVNSVILALHLFALMFLTFSLPTLLQSHLVRATSGYGRDLVIGMFFTMAFLFNSLWAGVIGYIVDIYESFRPALMVMGTLGLVALATLLGQMRDISAA
ncbi:MAG: MFS transporter, partial [Candidatus Bathyarchaeia archaeon]